MGRPGRGQELDGALGLADQVARQAAHGHACERGLLLPGRGHLLAADQVHQLVDGTEHCPMVEGSGEGEWHAPILAPIPDLLRPDRARRRGSGAKQASSPQLRDGSRPTAPWCQARGPVSLGEPASFPVIAGSEDRVVG